MNSWYYVTGIYAKFVSYNLVLLDFKQHPYHTCYMDATRTENMETTSEGNGVKLHES